MKSIFRGGFWGGVVLAAIILAGCGKAPPPSADKIADKIEAGKAQTQPTLQWPPHFSPSLEIHIAAPEVPAKLRGPSPPIDQKKT